MLLMAEKMERTEKEKRKGLTEVLLLVHDDNGQLKRTTLPRMTFSRLERHELEKALEIVNYRSQNPVVAELPPVPSPVGGASSAPSGGNDEGFGPDGKIVTCGSVPSTGCPDVGEEVLVTMKE